MSRNLFLLILLTYTFCWNSPLLSTNSAFAQKYAEQDDKAVKAEKERQKFLQEMQTLLDAALKSGFSEKEIREITVTRKGKIIHIWDFLEQEKLRQKKVALAKNKSKPRDRYLSVMDIANELEVGETSELDALKDKSIFVGAEEK
ncbi:MAG: hypothetical protein H8E38_13330 [SAR324 cluster bacterium]|nr:hypothetical protein [SAR324 cluster bacterium]MBL7034728.1 hypothetical protein [SAR324 cluster bacterium]